MVPSQKDLSAGQKAYQGLVSYERFKISQQSKVSVFFSVIAGLALLNQILADFSAGKYWMATWEASVPILILWGWHSMGKTQRKNFELLKQLKEKYGPEIYDALKKEPDTIQYKLFQKSYPPERHVPSVELP